MKCANYDVRAVAIATVISVWSLLAAAKPPSTYCSLTQEERASVEARMKPGEDLPACARRIVMENVTAPIVAPSPCTFETVVPPPPVKRESKILSFTMTTDEFEALNARAAELKLDRRVLTYNILTGKPLVKSSSPFEGIVGEPGDHYKRLARLDCTTDKSPIAYKCGETAVVTFSTPKTNGLEVTWTMRRDFDKEVVKGTGSVVRATLDKPGFVLISAKVGNGKWPYYYNAAIGFDVEKIVDQSKAPADLAAFWAKQKKAVAECDMKPRVAEVPSPTPGVKLYKVELDAPGMGKLASGWLSVPQNPKEKYPAIATFFGYNNSWGDFHFVAPKKVPADRIEFLVNAHAVELERDKAYYKAAREASKSNGHTHGLDPVQNAKPETCYFLGMVLRNLTAMRYLKSRPEWDGRNLMVKGHSQGGAQAAWMGALCDGVTIMCAEAPWLCDLERKMEGRLCSDDDVPSTEGIAYFDPCHLAALMPPTLDARIVRAGLGDTCCLPNGVTAFYNAIPCAKKSIRFAQGSRHSAMPIDTRWSVLAR